MDGFGVSWLAKYHADLLRAEFGLSEVGGYNIEFAGRRVYLVQVAEKGTCWLRVRAHGRPGHASLPHTDNAVLHLARQLNRLGSDGMPYHLTEAAAGFLEAASRAAGGELGQRLLGLRTPVEAERAFQMELAEHEMRPLLYAMLHNTATPTGLSAGIKTNVIPATAEAIIDGRTLPGTSTDDFLAEIRAVMGDKLDYEVTMATPPIEAPVDTALFRLMAETLMAHDPTAVAVLPYMMSAATDAKYLAPLGIPTYGFAPLQLPPGMGLMEMFHAHDERAPVEGLGWGVRVLYEVVEKYCG